MTSEHDPNMVLFVPLSNEPGPATPLSQEEAEALARAVVRRARVEGAGARFRWATAAAVPLAWWGAGVAFAAVAAYTVIASPTAPTPSTNAAARVRVQSAPSRPREPVRAEPTEASMVPGTEAHVAPNVEAPAVPERALPAPGRGADSLLDRANRLRAAGEYGRAEQLYSRAITSSTTDADALASMVAAASLRLEHLKRPKSALNLYERVLRQQPDGPLAASARYGVAQSHRALGQSGQEAAALQRFLLHHPAHLLAKTVHDRLRTLQAGPSE